MDFSNILKKNFKNFRKFFEIFLHIFEIFLHIFENFLNIFWKFFANFFENFFEKVLPPRKNPGYSHATDNQKNVSQFFLDTSIWLVLNRIILTNEGLNNVNYSNPLKDTECGNLKLAIYY